jgi:hypothetical protein
MLEDEKRKGSDTVRKGGNRANHANKNKISETEKEKEKKKVGEVKQNQRKSLKPLRGSKYVRKEQIEQYEGKANKSKIRWSKLSTEALKKSKQKRQKL